MIYRPVPTMKEINDWKAANPKTYTDLRKKHGLDDVKTITSAIQPMAAPLPKDIWYNPETKQTFIWADLGFGFSWMLVEFYNHVLGLREAITDAADYLEINGDPRIAVTGLRQAMEKP